MDKEVPMFDEKAEKKVTKKKVDTAFSLDQLLTSKRYQDKKDVLNVVLNRELEYNLKEVDRLIGEFMEGVK